VLILLYHRVTELPIDPQLLCVTPQHFAEHLDILRKSFNPLSLRQLMEGLRTGRLPSLGTVVTFDDGYFDNLGEAKPILDRYDVPATVFVATGYLGGTCEFWWDELERLLLHGRKLPDSLCLSINGSTQRWKLGQAAEPIEGWLDQNRRWNMTNLNDDTGPRQHLYASLCRLLRPLTDQARQSALAALRRWAGEEAAARSSHRALLPDEVIQLAEGSTIEVGAHTVTHPVLSALPVEAQREEVSQSKLRLQEILNTEVTSFSYPFGTHADYSPATVDIVKEAGFACACSNFEGLAGPGTSRFELPRVLIRDWDADTLTRRLHEAFDAR
jgi:peptidoglycan/xylan/chitin deacetylase (PgdA/CDA1 family)